MNAYIVISTLIDEKQNTAKTELLDVFINKGYAECFKLKMESRWRNVNKFLPENKGKDFKIEVVNKIIQYAEETLNESNSDYMKMQDMFKNIGIDYESGNIPVPDDIVKSFIMYSNVDENCEMVFYFDKDDKF